MIARRGALVALDWLREMGIAIETAIAAIVRTGHGLANDAQIVTCQGYRQSLPVAVPDQRRNERGW